MSSHVGYFPLEEFATYENFGQNDRDMSTAIVSVYTSDGFIIGADGLRKNTDGSDVTKTARKIFLFESEITRLAYAWSGTTQVFDSNNQSVFDFMGVSEPILRIADLLGGIDFAAFVNIFRRMLLVTLLQSRLTNNGRIVGTYPEDEIAGVLFVGYFNQQPCMAEIMVCHQNLLLLEPTIKTLVIPAKPNCNIFSGSKSLNRAWPKCKARSGAEAIDFVRKYIQACADSSEADCDDIGGHIHIGQITPEGFTWIDPPVSS
jgi:hypothetical protein